MAPRAKKTPVDFEASLKELESLVDRLEKGDLSLEEGLKSFERGVELTRLCQQVLAEAEQKVRILSTPDPQAELEDISSDE